MAPKGIGYEISGLLDWSFIQLRYRADIATCDIFFTIIKYIVTKVKKKTATRKIEPPTTSLLERRCIQLTNGAYIATCDEFFLQ